MSDIERFTLTVYDEVAVGIARHAARRMLCDAEVTARQVVGLGHALYALERLPASTPGTFVEFGLTLHGTKQTLLQTRFIDFRISNSDFEIARGGSIPGDGFSEPGWLIELSGYRRTECDLYNLEEEVGEFLRLDPEIIVNDESEIEFD